LALIDYDIDDDSYYLFACAELKAREIELIEKSKIDRMLGVAGVDDFFKILQETWYSKYLKKIKVSIVLWFLNIEVQ
jgi:vacuolar-type H+-ATPase subunit C/Vma6